MKEEGGGQGHRWGVSLGGRDTQDAKYGGDNQAQAELSEGNCRAWHPAGNEYIQVGRKNN